MDDVTVLAIAAVIAAPAYVLVMTTAATAVLKLVDSAFESATQTQLEKTLQTPKV
jgi:hypothetical protein